MIMGQSEYQAKIQNRHETVTDCNQPLFAILPAFSMHLSILNPFQIE